MELLYNNLKYICMHNLFRICNLHLYFFILVGINKSDEISTARPLQTSTLVYIYHCMVHIN